MRLLFTVVWGFLLVAGAAAQEDRGDAAAGLAYATNVCSECHAIAAGDHDSPNPDTPGFDDIANTRGISEMALASFFQTPHRRDLAEFGIGAAVAVGNGGVSPVD